MGTIIEHCTACQAEIFWLRHVRTGKWAPIDAELRSDGNIACDFEAGTYRIVTSAEDPLPGIEPIAELRVNHFASCPQAGRFRPKAKQKQTA